MGTAAPHIFIASLLWQAVAGISQPAQPNGRPEPPELRFAKSHSRYHVHGGRVSSTLRRTQADNSRDVVPDVRWQADWAHDLSVLKDILRAWPEVAVDTATSLCHLTPIVICNGTGFHSRWMPDDWAGSIYVVDTENAQNPSYSPVSVRWWELKRIGFLRLTILGGGLPIPSGGGLVPPELRALRLGGMPNLATATHPGHPQGTLSSNFWRMRGFRKIYFDEFWGFKIALPTDATIMRNFCENLTAIQLYTMPELTGNIEIFQHCSKLNWFTLDMTRLYGDILHAIVPHMRGPDLNGSFEAVYAGDSNLTINFPQDDSTWQNFCRQNALFYFHVEGNAKGTLPGGFAHCGAELVALKILAKGEGKLSGNLDHINWQQFPHLVEFDMSGHRFTGNLPCLPLQTERVYLANNQLEGPIPLCWAINANLAEVNLTRNRISGPPSPWGHVSDDWSDVDAAVGGKVPSYWKPHPGMNLLHKIDVSHNPINISFPWLLSNLCRFPNLRSLSCSGCGLYSDWADRDEILQWKPVDMSTSSWSGDSLCPSLEDLDLSDNLIPSIANSQGICLEFKRPAFAHLKSLKLQGNKNLSTVSPFFFDVSVIDVRGTSLHGMIYADKNSCPSSGELPIVCRTSAGDPMRTSVCHYPESAVTRIGNKDCKRSIVGKGGKELWHIVEADTSFNDSGLCQCIAGHVPDAPGTCRRCGANEYAASGDPTCTPCPRMSTTDGEIAVKVEDCKCAAGYFMFGGLCIPCPNNTWSIIKGAVRFDVCYTCPPHTATLRPGASSSRQCLCEAGFVDADRNGSVCEPCAKGSYKEAIGHHACQGCPAGRTTLVDGAHMAEQCLCDVGSYGTPGTSICHTCQLGYTTALAGSTSSESCEIESWLSWLISVLVLIFVVLAVILIVRSIYKRRMNVERRVQHREIIRDSIKCVTMLQFPFAVMNASVFLDMETMPYHELALQRGQLHFLHMLEEIELFKEKNLVIFFSHQWLGFGEPDPAGTQFRCMKQALHDIAISKGVQLDDVYVWLDYFSIPQIITGTQKGAIGSLPIYASMASVFIIVAPSAAHINTQALCDAESYQRRVWTRAEQMSHYCRRGLHDMYLHDGNQLSNCTKEWVMEALYIFEGDCTCCFMKHSNIQTCDKQYLVKPVLGLFAELSVSHVGDEQLTEVYNHIVGDMERMFPLTFTSEYQKVGIPRTSLGYLLRLMRRAARRLLFRKHHAKWKGTISRTGTIVGSAQEMTKTKETRPLFAGLLTELAALHRKYPMAVEIMLSSHTTRKSHVAAQHWEVTAQSSARSLHLSMGSSDVASQATRSRIGCSSFFSDDSQQEETRVVLEVHSVAQDSLQPPVVFGGGTPAGPARPPQVMEARSESAGHLTSGTTSRTV